MTSLVFRLLDHHVISGLADDLAVADDRGTVSYAQLLHESACIAAGLHHMGVDAGTAIVLDGLHGRDLVTAVTACARIGAVPAASGDFRLVGSPPVLHAPGTEVTWDVLDKAGRTEPHTAPDRDAQGYEPTLRAAYPDIIETLEQGGTVEAR
ncbi:AMP-binding protein [Aeromicrobium fastidiosum]|uniref:AMP-binding protein n=1 Tax=Aeromicrobium fastidiosum TaxID=52699 RepID=UPI0020232B30|nr:AMP-binding protein [Aeromicrobium fastidiosum]MCL8250207.1 AMP-binding protein [Aeromicrobium fastidiosum]